MINLKLIPFFVTLMFLFPTFANSITSQVFHSFFGQYTFKNKTCSSKGKPVHSNVDPLLLTISNEPPRSEIIYLQKIIERDGLIEIHDYALKKNYQSYFYGDGKTKAGFYSDDAIGDMTYGYSRYEFQRSENSLIFKQEHLYGAYEEGTTSTHILCEYDLVLKAD